MQNLEPVTPIESGLVIHVIGFQLIQLMGAPSVFTCIQCKASGVADQFGHASGQIGKIRPSHNLVVLHSSCLLKA